MGDKKKYNMLVEATQIKLDERTWRKMKGNWEKYPPFSPVFMHSYIFYSLLPFVQTHTRTILNVYFGHIHKITINSIHVLS